MPIVAIANPNSGPGSPTEQKLYLPLLRSAHKAGVSVVGYVYTDHGKKPIETATKEITSWKKMYGETLSGIFLDAQASDKKYLKYYRTLAEHVRKEFAPAVPLIVGNPGTRFDPEFLSDAVSAACFYENGGAKKLADLNVPEFFDRDSWPRSCVLAYKVARGADMAALVKELTAKEIGFLYVTDRHLEKDVLNPWAGLPSYWKEQVEAVAAANKAAREGTRS